MGGGRGCGRYAPPHAAPDQCVPPHRLLPRPSATTGYAPSPPFPAGAPLQVTLRTASSPSSSPSWGRLAPRSVGASPRMAAAAFWREFDHMVRGNQTVAMASVRSACARSEAVPFLLRVMTSASYHASPPRRSLLYHIVQNAPCQMGTGKQLLHFRSDEKPQRTRLIPTDLFATSEQFLPYSPVCNGAKNSIHVPRGPRPPDTPKLPPRNSACGPWTSKRLASNPRKPYHH
jgi:hypothetical protein